MSESAGSPAAWTAFVEEMNRSVLDAVEENVEAQSRFVDAWFGAVDDSWTTSPGTVASGMEGYARAYEEWMRGFEQQLDRVTEAISGEEVTPEDVRNLWLTTANRAFKEVMSTPAFAAATGQQVGDALEVQQRVDESAEETLHALRFATAGDVEEVGERLVELERRQQAVEDSLDRILAAVESEATE